jgi:hypothetical protein
MSSPQPAQTVEDREKERIAEYSKWVAVVPIDIHGARAFNPGDPVPVSHVDRGVVASHQVTGRNTKTGQAVTASDESSKG